MSEKLVVRLRDAKDVEEVDLAEVGPVTNDIIKNIVEYASSHYVGNVRWTMGRIWTEEDYEARKKRVLSKPFP